MMKLRDYNLFGEILLAGLACIMILASPASAQDIKVHASVDNTQITLEDTIQLSVTVEGIQNAPAPDIPKLSEFKVNSGGTSSSLKIINGQRSASTTFNYQLIPRAEGEFVIAPFQFQIEGNPYLTAPITIQVLPKVKRPAGQAPVFVEATVSTHQPYLNEQLILTFRVFHKVDIRNLDLDFSHDQFRKRDLGDPHKYTRVIKGVRYSVFEKTVALFAMRTGKVTLPSAIIGLDIMERKSGRAMDQFRPFFDDPFFDNPMFHNQINLVHKNLRTDPILLEVLPLPGRNRPKNDTHLVGQFDLSANINKTELEANDTATLTVTVSGTGNVNEAEVTLPDLKNQFKVYADTPEFEDTTSRQGVSGRKVFKFALVPVTAGTFILPPVTLSFFNPQVHTYQTLKSGTHKIHIKPSPEEDELKVVEPIPQGEAPRKSVPSLGVDINPIHTHPDKVLEADWSTGTLILVILGLILPPAGFAAFYFYYRHQRRLREDQAYSRKQQAFQKAREQIDRLAHTGNGKETVQELSYIVREYIGNKLNMKGTAFTSAEVEEKLRSENFEEKKVLSTKALLEKYESLQYSSSTHDNPESLLTESKELLSLLEDK